MKITHLPNSRKSGAMSSALKGKIRNALRKSATADHAAVCLLGDATYVAHLTSGEKVYVNKLAHVVVHHELLAEATVNLDESDDVKEGESGLTFDVDPTSTFIAIAPKREAALYSENRLVSVLFVKNGHIVESRDGRLSPELATYIAQQASSVYNKTIVRFAGMHINAVEELVSGLELGVHWLDVNVAEYPSEEQYFEELPVDLLRNIYKESPINKVIKLSLIGALCVGAVVGYNFYASESVPKETHTTIDEYQQHRAALSGVHASEHFYRFVEVLNAYHNKAGWSVLSVKGAHAGRYKAILTPTTETISTPVTPFLLWSRENINLPFELIEGNRLSIDGQFTPVNYLEVFHPYVADFALNIAQIQDVTSVLGASAIKFNKVEKKSNFKTLMFTISFRSISLHELEKLYEALERVPVVSKDLEIQDLKDGTFAITHTMEFVGN